ncbi:MAG: GntR family transcriptional regulator [Deltaproteobacteria bacterium]|jgi:DNA-binding GntR family transcriptional regulator|nr:MAG: GntR family transcriptional regulator [Deltaproteobacteria bacterium]
MPKNKDQNQAVPLSEVAYQKIKERIVTLKLRPRDQVDENVLVEELSIGRTPIREALFRLVAENLVAVVHGRGFFVRDITLSDLRDLFETMLILERSAVSLAARRIQKDQIKNLQQLNAALRHAYLKKDFLRVTLLNSQFHRSIYKATDNAFLFSYLDNLQSQSQRLAYICFSKETVAYDIKSHAELSIKDHQSLIELFKRRSDLEAVNVITEHIKLFQRRVLHFTSPSLESLDLINP